MNTLTLAAIYELQGFKEEALKIYKEILQKDPANQEARIAIRRLSGIRKKFSGVNSAMKQKFISMESAKERKEFERWLLELWI